MRVDPASKETERWVWMIQDHVSNRRYRNTFEDNDGLDWQGQRGEIQGGGVWAGRVEGREAQRERERSVLWKQRQKDKDIYRNKPQLLGTTSLSQTIGYFTAISSFKSCLKKKKSKRKWKSFGIVCVVLNWDAVPVALWAASAMVFSDKMVITQMFKIMLTCKMNVLAELFKEESP